MKIGIVALVLLGTVVLYARGGVGLRVATTTKTTSHAVEPRARVALAWEESLEQLELVGVVRKQSETHTEFAHRAGRSMPERSLQLDELASLADVVTYAPDEIDDAEATRADDAATAIVDTVHARVPRHTVWLSRLDPRRLLGASPATAASTGAFLEGLTRTERPRP